MCDAFWVDWSAPMLSYVLVRLGNAPKNSRIGSLVASGHSSEKRLSKIHEIGRFPAQEVGLWGLSGGVPHKRATRLPRCAAQPSGGVWACFWMFSLPSARGRNDFSYYFSSMQSFRAQELRPSGRGWCAVARCRGGRLGSVRWPEIAQNALQTV